MPGEDRTLEARDAEDGSPRWRRSVYLVALSTLIGNFSVSFWLPFLPLLMKDLGAESDARAVFLVGLAFTGTGIARMLTGPGRGMLADRYGRKTMLVVALYASAGATMFAASGTSPWQIIVAFTVLGACGGFNPSAVALASVLSPRRAMMNSMGLVQGSLYAGNAIGPVVGGLLASAFSLRGAVLAGALLPAVSATIVLLTVPRDRVTPVATPAPSRAGRGGVFLSLVSLQFLLGALIYFLAFATSQLVRTTTPVAFDRLVGSERAAAVAGLAFSAAGLASVVGALALARLANRARRLRLSLAVLLSLSAAAYALLALAVNVPLYIVWFATIALVQGAALPASNTIIASSVPAERWGTAFGVAGTGHALGLIVGPLGAAFFTAVSLELGYLVCAVLLAACAGAVLLWLREPDLDEQPRPEGGASAGAPGEAGLLQEAKTGAASSASNG